MGMRLTEKRQNPWLKKLGRQVAIVIVVLIGNQLIVAQAVATASAKNQPTPSAQKPNILFLLSDDQLWSGLSVAMHPDYANSKSQVINTPHIARLAAQGMRFSRAYAPAPVCSPTRISLQTGKSPAQLNWTKAAPVITARDGLKLLPPSIDKNIQRSEVTVAELLRQQGYATAHYGKWHISGGGPAAHGYDESDGDTGNADAVPHAAPNPVDIFGMGQRAMDFMGRSRAAHKPFFIQMSYHALHHPENADPKLVQKYQRLLSNNDTKKAGRAALAEDLDRGVGLLMKRLDELGISDNTYVIYMSDNGSGGSKVLTGGKGNLWEGGVRVPLIVRGPNIAANSFNHQAVVGYDLLPTFYALAGGDQPLPVGVEGGSITHLLAGGSQPVLRAHSELVFHFPHYQSSTPHSVIYQGDYKLMHFYEDNSVKLFDLGRDIGESRDLSKQLPDLSNGLLAKLNARLASLNAGMPEINPAYDGVTEFDPKAHKGGKNKAGGKNANKPNKNSKKNKTAKQALR